MVIGTADNSIHHPNPYAAQTEDRDIVEAIDKADDDYKVETQKLSKEWNEPQDEYIPGGDERGETPGIYRLEKDETGQQKIVFVRPDSAEKGEQSDAAEKIANGDLPEAAPDQAKDREKPEKQDGPEKSKDKKDGVRCTVNTDKVDAEIRKLKEEKQQIEQKLHSTRNDEDKRKELERRLSQVETELMVKDNDAYRKQNATYTNQ